MSNTADKPITIGVISDTHGLLRPAAVDALQGVDHILHAGDVGDIHVLDALRMIAPVIAIRGNVDVSGACAILPPTEAVEIKGRLFYLLHNLEHLDISPHAAGIAAVIFGHTHRAEIRHDNVLYLNPGSAGPRRFDLPITVAKIVIDDGELIARIIPI
ncbi:MAG TPA: metallophosphoesterase family protein [Acidobacteriaceae bacterium]|nr:metallophosphoesterase family protein [Acidobacteriaceae bacterium]